MEDLAGWGHFAWELLQAARDDLGAPPVCLWALRAPQPDQAAARQVRCTRWRAAGGVSVSRILLFCLYILWS